MLKALELAGFKSFADRTRFDFPDGITVVVGPNGSGKSNIVDAIKWVLGSQSAKGLRGKDMSDVIFKGSQTRQPAGAAEATIIFDNADGTLPVDAPEVHVTRRVYRSGESEYLINKQAVRLKDVRDLIRGTGIGIDAYSLIEQGKVDRMLQANAKDRRAIFEEAAGISRFKAKKLEAERRLARVQTNLTRLGDIVDEVASRLKSVRSQASKAERYRQATERLKELRTVVAWTDWNQMLAETESVEKELADANATLKQLEADRERLAAERQTADAELQQIAEQAQQFEAVRSQHAQSIAELNGRREADETSIADLRPTIAKALRRFRLLKRQAGSAAEELKGAAGKLNASARELANVRSRSETVEQHRKKIQEEVDGVLQRRDKIQREHLATVRQVADWESTQQTIHARIAEAERTVLALNSRIETATEELDESNKESEAASARCEDLKQKIERASSDVRIANSKAEENRRTLARRQEEQAGLKTRLEGVRQRHIVLEDLQRRQEGVSGGVRTLLGEPGEGLGGPNENSHRFSSSVVGMVADFISADVKIAKMIDAALGPRSQYVVVTGTAIQDALQAGQLEIDGRVGLLRLDDLPAERPAERIKLDGLEGVIGRADRLVRYEPEHETLVRHLLSSTWVVDSLSSALKLRKLGGRDLRFVTEKGEILEIDGASILGPTASATGLISRRSELEAAAEEIEHYTFQISDNEKEIRRLAVLVEQQDSELGRAEQVERGLVTDLAGAEAERRHAVERQSLRQNVFKELQQELASAQETQDSSHRQDVDLQGQIQQGRKKIETLELESAEMEEMLSETQSALQAATSAVMDVSVDLARAEQKHEALSVTIENQRRDQNERESAVGEALAGADSGRERLKMLDARIAEAANQLAELKSKSEENESQLRQLAEKSAAVRQTNREVIVESEKAMKAAAKASEAVHAITSRRENLTMRADTLAERLQEDYQIDLRNDEPPEDLQQPEDRKAVEDEISRLRDQLQRTSNVNMEALHELEGLQERYDHLNSQYEDLTAAKDSLQRIIGRINADSRRLFLDTLEAIRQNFQKLYRKSFGGGHADLVLEDSEDPLEAGVEIVATPPGKPSFSNSLLSGGEKALTAVALLMSIFQYRPSPFCVLDEVDAPFDEANIGRFVTVLNEFLDHSKFVVVTHSKKTMTAATTLYGVTMQESGVSKQVSIRFEDVSDNGEINEGEAA